MTRGADVLFFAFCLKAAGVQNDRDEIVVRSVVSVAGTSRRLVEKFPITPRARNDPDPIGSGSNIFVDDLPASASRLSRAETGTRFAQTRPCGSDPVSYTHLTLPTIYSV